jgi:hypothetical protein
MAGKFGGLLGGGSGTGIPNASDPGRGVIRSNAAAAPPAVAVSGRPRLPRVGVRPTPAFAIALDATGSMTPLIDDARRHISEILVRVRAQLGRPIQVKFLCYRDYDVFDPRNQSATKELLDTSPMTEDAQALSAWLAKVEACYGGSNFGEAIETALEAACHITTGEGSRVAAVLLAGDEPSNRRADLDAIGRHQTATAHDWARRLGEHKVPIHTFVVGDRPNTPADFAEIARLSGGKTGRLDGSMSMLNMPLWQWWPQWVAPMPCVAMRHSTGCPRRKKRSPRCSCQVRHLEFHSPRRYRHRGRLDRRARFERDRG